MTNIKQSKDLSEGLTPYFSNQFCIGLVLQKPLEGKRLQFKKDFSTLDLVQGLYKRNDHRK